MQYRNDIQGLRAVAFLLVFFFHLNANCLPGGFVGVDIFLVISGFLITTIILNDINNQKFSFKTFYTKRLKRLVPAYYVLLFFIALLTPFVYLYADVTQLRGTLLRAITFISNEVFKKGDSYFGAQLSENPLLHTWSLSIEMQFYFILPFIIYFFRKHLLLLLSSIAIILTLYTSYQIYFEGLKTIAYFSLSARIPEFLIGSIAGILSSRKVKLSSPISLCIGIISLLAIGYSAIYITGASNFPGILALIPCLGAGILLLYPNPIVSKLLSNPVLVYIGKLSYSLYLWHWPIMAFFRYHNNQYDFSTIEMCIISLMTFSGAALSFYLIESKTHLWQRKRSILYSLPIVAIFLALVYFNPHIAERYKKIPDAYAQNLLGYNSHYNGILDTFGDLTRHDAIFLTGNSHADAIKAALDKIGKEKHFSFTTLTSRSFPPINGVDRIKLEEYNEHLSFSQALLPKVQTAMANAKLIIFCAQGIHEHQELVEGLDEIVKNLRADQHLLTLSSFPIVDKNPLIINKSIVKQSNYQYKIDLLEKDKSVYSAISKASKNATFIDISKLDIWANAPYINDTIAYYDANHINYYGATKLAKAIEDDLGGFINKLLNK